MATTHSRSGYLAALATLFIWTGFILVSRMGGKTPLTLYDMLALRLATASLVLLVLKGPVAQAHWQDPRNWLLALTGGLGFCLLAYAGFKLAPAAHAAILLPGIQPFLSALLVWGVWRELPHKARWPAYLAIAAGVVLTAWPMFASGTSASVLSGDALLLGASLCWAVFTTLGRRWQVEPWLQTRFVTLASACVFLPVYLLFLPKGVSATPWPVIIGQALYQGIGPAILAMVCFLMAVSRLGLEKTAALIALAPVLAGLLAVPLLSEAVTVYLLGGLVLVTFGAWWAVRPLPATA